jgi:predicted DNA-binding transcriptional regulator AlpA
MKANMRAKTKSDSSPLLGPKELAARLNVKIGTIFSWISRGVDLPPFVRIGGTTRWRSEVVEWWIERKEKEERRLNFE